MRVLTHPLCGTNATLHDGKSHRAIGLDQLSSLPKYEVYSCVGMAFRSILKTSKALTPVSPSWSRSSVLKHSINLDGRG